MRLSNRGAYDWKCGQWSAHVNGGEGGIEAAGTGVGIGVAGGSAVEAVEAEERQVKRENDGGADTRRRVIFCFGEQHGNG